MTKRMILNGSSYFGPGAVKVLPEELKKRGFERILVVTDSETSKNKVSLKIAKLLASSKTVYQIFDKADENPSVQTVRACVDYASLFRADCIIAAGGGSVIDTAKAVSIILSNPEFRDVRKLEGEVKVQNSAVPLIAVTTTSGSASEATSAFVITDDDRQRKIVCINQKSIPVVSIVDTELSASVPEEIAANAGAEALAAAVEGYITKDSWLMTDMYCLEAVKIISANLKDAVKGKAAARELMAYGQYIAGMGFSNAGLGLVHAMAHSVSAVFDVPHGLACAVLLAPVLSYNAPSSGTKYKELAAALGAKVSSKATPASYRKACITAAEKLLKEAGLPKKLGLNAEKKDIEFMADMAVKDLYAAGSPKEAAKKKIMDIYKSVL